MPRISTRTLTDARQGADQLDQHGHPQLATAVRDLAEAVEGRVWAGEDGKPAFLGTADPNLPLFVDQAFAEHIKTAVAADPAASTVTGVVLEGLEAFRDGRWEPEEPVPSMDTATRKTLNVRAPKDLTDSATEKAVAVAARKGWKRMGSAKRIATAYLVHRYGLPGQDDTAG